MYSLCEDLWLMRFIFTSNCSKHQNERQSQKFTQKSGATQIDATIVNIYSMYHTTAFARLKFPYDLFVVLHMCFLERISINRCRSCLIFCFVFLVTFSYRLLFRRGSIHLQKLHTHTHIIITFLCGSMQPIQSGC